MIIIRKDKKKYQIYLSKKNKVIYHGHFTLVKSYKILIDQVEIYKKNHKTNINENELLNIIKDQKIVLTKKDNTLTMFLEQEMKKFTIQDICDNCIKIGQVKLLNQKNNYTLYEKHYCKPCSINYIKNIQYSNNNFDFDIKRYTLLLEKYHDLAKILDNIDEQYNPQNKKFTLYDTLTSTEEEYDKIPVDKLNLPEEFIQVLGKRIEYLMPVQKLALEYGLLDDINLLVVSATASGKTLIGELTGIPKALNDRKMIYLTPYVALANQKYRDFKRDYEQLGLNVVIKVGQNRVKVEDELHIKQESVTGADIIVATYEGLDYILRSGQKDILGNIGTVIIDEIQMLENEDRGSRLHGLINRLLTLYPHTQLIALSATIKNSDRLAELFNMKLVTYDKRPISLERHIVPLKSHEKKKFIRELCLKEFSNVSSKNYHGQTIIFTDSRRKTITLSNYLSKNGVKSAYYHAGLTYHKKLEIEEKFLEQEISTIVTTSALSSGIDFPASQVIFDSLRMGYEWITHNEFHQMLGRAGRPSYHDKGKVYLLPVINENHDDYNYAFELLESGVENVNVAYDVDDFHEQLLADICAIGRVDLDSLEESKDYFYPVTFQEVVENLFEYKLIRYDDNKEYVVPTAYGVAVSKSFISVSTAEYIRNNLYGDVIGIVLNIECIRNVFVNNRLYEFLHEHYYNVSIRLFSDVNREIIYHGGLLHYLPKELSNNVMNLVNDFLVCDCKSSPYCDCFEKNISEHIINRRLQGWSPSDINREFGREYAVLIYNGDIYSYLDHVIMVLDSVKRIAHVFDAQSTLNSCNDLIKKIEG